MNTKQKKRISVYISKKTSDEIRQGMIKEDYKTNEKSKWVAEAILELLTLQQNDIKKYEEIIKAGRVVRAFDKREEFYLSVELDYKIEDSVILLKKLDPTIEGGKSLIVRASIVRRLLYPIKKNKS